MTVGAEIVAWLEGLEAARESVVGGSCDAREVATMIARRGVYEGIADDLKRKWPALFEATQMPSEAELDSPNFVPEAAKELAARGYERINRRAADSSGAPAKEKG